VLLRPDSLQPDLMGNRDHDHLAMLDQPVHGHPNHLGAGLIGVVLVLLQLLMLDNNRLGSKSCKYLDHQVRRNHGWASSHSRAWILSCVSCAWQHSSFDQLAYPIGILLGFGGLGGLGGLSNLDILGTILGWEYLLTYNGLISGFHSHGHPLAFFFGRQPFPWGILHLWFSCQCRFIQSNDRVINQHASWTHNNPTNPV
jgi:hypothetical protein